VKQYYNNEPAISQRIFAMTGTGRATFPAKP